MRLIKCKDYDEMSKTAAEMVAGQLLLKPASVLGLAAGSTPIGMYAKLVSMYEAGKVDFSEATAFNLDEYYPISRESDQSYYFYMERHLYSKVNLKSAHIPDGEADDAYSECENYDKMMETLGGIDLQILGIGGNGHIGFNEPGESLNAGTHITELTQSTIEANARFFESREQVPARAITMGIGSIMKARKILLLASGKNKREPLKKLLAGKITTASPVTILNLHPDVVIIADIEAIG